MSTGLTHTRHWHGPAALIPALAFVTIVAASPAMAQRSDSGLRTGYLTDMDQ